MARGGNTYEEIERMLEDLVRRRIIRCWWAEQRVDYDAFMIRVEYVSPSRNRGESRYQEWMLQREDLFYKKDAARFWAERILRDIMRENENTAAQIIMQPRRYEPVGYSFDKWNQEWDIPSIPSYLAPAAKPEPKAKPISPSNAYRLDNIDFT